MEEKENTEARDRMRREEVNQRREEESREPERSVV